MPIEFWQATSARAIGLWRDHPVAMTFGIMLVLAAARLLVYWAIAHDFGGLGHALCNYDCAWYEHTARAGYDLGPDGDAYGDTANWAFFPLYPLLLAAGSAIAPPDGMTWTGILLSSACFAGFATLGALYLTATAPTPVTPGAPAGPPVPLAWLAFASLWPGDLYFALPYSEGLYALLMTASLLALTRRQPLGAAAASSALSATRPPGLLMTPVIILDRLQYLRRQHRAGRLRRAPWTVVGRVLLPIAVAPLGLFLFMAYLRWHVGDGLAFIHVQSAWNRHALPPWVFLWTGLTADDWGRVLHAPARESLSVEAAFGIAGLVLAVYQIKLRRYAEAWLIGASVLIASSSGLQSMPRFVLSNPVVIFALYRIASAAATWRRLALIGIVLGLIQLLFVVAWFIGAPVLA